MECVVCKKHQDFSSFTGSPMCELGGLVVSHFPIIDGVPANRGHLLIEPKRHVVDVGDLTDDESKSLGLLISKSIRVLTKNFGGEHAYAFRINDITPHFHFHVIPRFPNTPKEYWGHKISDWPGAAKVGLEEIQTISQQLKNKFDLN
jgi:histidine triad (HIT) family protein